MSMEISPELIKKFKQGAFLDGPADAKTGFKNGQESKTWRETFVIQSINIGTNDDGSEHVSFKLRVPSDVISNDQGRIADLYLGFPLEQDSTQFEISGRTLFELFKAVGYAPVINGAFQLEHIDKDALVNMRLSAQVTIAADKKGIVRQNIGYLRAPK